LVQIVPPVATSAGHYAARHYAAAEAVGRDYLEGIAKRVQAHGHEASIAVTVGAPETEIAREAREFQSDLIVMTTRGRSGFSRLIFGSVAEGVAQLGLCPVLVVTQESAASSTVAGLTSAPIIRRARDIMVTDVITAGPDTTVEDLARLMLDNRIGSIPLLDDAGTVVGIVTESDFAGEEFVPPLSMYRMPQLFGQWIPRAGIERIYEAGRSLRASQ